MSKKVRNFLWILVGLGLLIGLYLIPGGKKEEFDVADEFVLKPIIKLPKIGPVDLSVTKAVIYLWLAVALVAVLAIIVRFGLKEIPGRFQSLIETLYDTARNGIVGSVMKTDGDKWFPFIASLFFFILISNLLGLIPLPFGENHQLVFYAATGNLYVTATLALMTFVLTHYAGIRKAGAGYARHWVIPGSPPGMKQFVYLMEVLSEFFRLISLSVRLFANMLAGHTILAVFFAMALIFQNYAVAAILQAGSLVFYLFEIFVAFIQAFIFAILSAVYIGGAIEEEH